MVTAVGSFEPEPELCPSVVYHKKTHKQVGSRGIADAMHHKRTHTQVDSGGKTSAMPSATPKNIQPRKHSRHTSNSWGKYYRDRKKIIESQVSFATEFGHMTPMQHECCKDCVKMYDGGWRRSALRSRRCCETSREVAHAIEKEIACSSDLQTPDAAAGRPTPCRCGLLHDIVWLLTLEYGY